MKLNQTKFATNAHGAFTAPQMRIPEFRNLVVAGVRDFGLDIMKC